MVVLRRNFVDAIDEECVQDPQMAGKDCDDYAHHRHL